MENTLAEKKKFFGQYINQEILMHPDYGNNFKSNVSNYFISLYNIDDGYYLELTPLHLISDEDAIEVANITGFVRYKLENGKRVCDSLLISKYDEWISETILFQDLFIVYDYLRSKGYALPYNGLSVEEQVSRNWVVLRTKI